MAYDPNDPNANPPMQPPDIGSAGTADLEAHLPGGTADLETRVAAPRMNPMLHPVEEPSPQGPPPSGKERFHNTMADFEHRAENNRAEMMGLSAEDPQYLQKMAALQAQHGSIAAEKARYQMLHPWGGPESAHPGVFGKIGHVLGEIGQVAGGAVAPGVVQAIPGTRSNLAAKGLAGQAEEKAGETAGKEAAETGEAEARAGATEAGEEQTREKTKEMENAPAPAAPTPLEQYGAAEQNLRANPDDPKAQQEFKDAQDAITGIQPQKTPAEKTPPHITVQGPDGKNHIMERNPQTGAYDIDRGIAPENYAQIAPQLQGSKTTEMLGPDNVQHRYQFNPRTQAYDIDMGPAPTGTAAHQIFQSGAIEELAPRVIADINANRAILGNLESYYKQWTAGTPVSDPKAAQLMGELMSLAATQPALHAFRSRNALEGFEKLIGGLAKNPDATIASIQGLMVLPQIFTGMPKGGQRGGPVPSAGEGGRRPSFSQWDQANPAGGH